MQLSKALEGFILDISAGDYSRETVKLYKFVLGHLVTRLEDPELGQVTHEGLTEFMVSLGKYSGSYQDNHWKAIRTFFEWSSHVLGIRRPDLDLARPRFKPPAITPFTEQEIKKLLEACMYTPVFQRANTKPYRIRRPTGVRDKAVILILLDTGIRVGELTRAEVRDLELTTGELLITPYSTGRKTKPRSVWLGVASRRAVWQYLAHREKYEPDDKLIPHTASGIRSVLTQIGENAGVADVHPHKFRHTFAIQYLRNGGDVFTLQRLLGHSSLDMVNHYLAIAKTDTAAAHMRASPVDRWKL